MELIPVLDLKGGRVVRALMGERRNYHPIKTPLANTSDPVDVMRGLLSIYPFGIFYAADLDAIEGRGGNGAVLARLKTQGAAGLWVDNGLAERLAVQGWIDEGLGDLVIGSETQKNAALLRDLGSEQRIILSLDFRGDQFQGPPAVFDAVEAWPHRVIVMSLGRVGSGAGPDLALLDRVQKAAGPQRKIYAAGGIRDGADLITLHRAGVYGALIASCLHEGRLTAAEIGALQALSGWEGGASHRP
jgi:phosphoribosylformimino-5-aminoimidazole carboxamide ribotide isomerase